jgi:hypothetical protein
MVGEVHDLLRLNDQWLVGDQLGFTWWADDFAQRVWSDVGVFHHATTVYRLHSETDLLRGRGRAHHFELELERQMDACTLSGVIYDRPSDTFKLHCSIFVSEENAGYLRKAFAGAVALQVAEAHRIGHDLARRLGAVPASSAHPTAGIRSTPDTILQRAPEFFRPAGALPSRWSGVTEWRDVELMLDREAMTFTCNHSTEFTAQFAFDPIPGSATTLTATCHEPHPVLGNGLHFTLVVPLPMPPDRAAHMALELNNHEREQWKRSHMLGSWCLHEERLAFRAFVPNALYNPDLLPHCAVNMALRAQWVNEFFYAMKMQASQASA